MELGLCEIVYVKNLSRFVPFSFKERIQKGQEVCDRIVSVRLILLNSIIVKNKNGIDNKREECLD